jgi:signal transduction histidine kinase
MNDNIYILIIISIAGIFLIITGFILLQVRNQNKLLQKQKQIAAAEITHQRSLLQAVITSQEAERKRIGMDLHDEVGAALSTLRIKIESNAGDTAAGNELTANYKLDIDRIITNMRNISHSLSPRISGNFGFYDAIHELSDRVNNSGKINVVVDFDEQQLPVFTNEHAPMALYRVLSELINNTLKHASASLIEITINVAPNEMKIIYSDNGKGILQNPAIPAKGMGIQNIESRLSIIGAEWQIQIPGTGGYGMMISVPLNKS